MNITCSGKLECIIFSEVPQMIELAAYYRDERTIRHNQYRELGKEVADCTDHHLLIKILVEVLDI